jgi:transposase-like protein
MRHGLRIGRCLAVRAANGANSFKRHHFPADVISHAVWLCFRFTLSFRDVEEMLAQRGLGIRT